MYIKTLSFAAAAMIGVVSVAAFAEPSHSTPAQVALVSGNLAVHSSRELVNKASLEWPKDASPSYETKVVLRYTVEADGTVDNVQTLISPADPAFAKAARAAVERWTYAPSDAPTENLEAVAYFHAAK
jgi:TonB family protein